MPGGDGTGPLGFGPGTGRATGFCGGYPAPGFANFMPGRMRFRGSAFFNPWSYRMSAGESKEVLEQQSSLLKKQLQLLEDRLAQLNENEQ